MQQFNKNIFVKMDFETRLKLTLLGSLMSVLNRHQRPTDVKDSITP